MTPRIETLRGTSVLIIEDDPEMRRTLSGYLARLGMEVHQADAGIGGLNAFKNEDPELTLLDLGLPDLPGFEVLEQIVPLGGVVIILTGEADVDTAVRAMQMGAENFLTKPVDGAHLAAALVRAYEKVRLKREAFRLRFSGAPAPDLGSLGDSPEMMEIQKQVRLLAKENNTVVMLTGESGTGKGHVARLIHEASPRRRDPFVQVNCSTLTPTLLESELFGHERGAFTGAEGKKFGLLEVAHEGTVFLDEVGELSSELQPKLLEVLEERAFRRVGGTHSIPLQARVLAATNRDLEEAVRNGGFRRDLFYRLSVFPLRLLPLRERSRQDRLVVLESIFGELSWRFPEGPSAMESEVIDRLLRYPWPGNVREMRNTLERLLILASGSQQIELRHLPPEFLGSAMPAEDSVDKQSLREVEHRHIERVLRAQDLNRTRTAEILGISRTTLLKKIKEFGLD